VLPDSLVAKLDAEQVSARARYLDMTTGEASSGSSVVGSTEVIAVSMKQPFWSNEEDSYGILLVSVVDGKWEGHSIEKAIVVQEGNLTISDQILAFVYQKCYVEIFIFFSPFRSRNVVDCLRLVTGNKTCWLRIPTESCLSLMEFGSPLSRLKEACSTLHDRNDDHAPLDECSRQLRDLMLEGQLVAAIIDCLEICLDSPSDASSTAELVQAASVGISIAQSGFDDDTKDALAKV
jgi:hypothetical protein